MSLGTGCPDSSPLVVALRSACRGLQAGKCCKYQKASPSRKAIHLAGRVALCHGAIDESVHGVLQGEPEPQRLGHIYLPSQACRTIRSHLLTQLVQAQQIQVGVDYLQPMPQISLIEWTRRAQAMRKALVEHCNFSSACRRFLQGHLV